MAKATTYLSNEVANTISTITDNSDSQHEINAALLNGAKTVGVTAVAGTNINQVGTPSVTAGTPVYDTQNMTLNTPLTFNYLKGAKGDTGPQGAKGDTGAQGAKGDTGAQGPQGLKGDTGPQGPQGEQGEKGEKGDKGDTGAQGPQGEQGEKGGAKVWAGPGDYCTQVGTPTVSTYVATDGYTYIYFNYLKGEKGDKGDKGDTGATGATGATGRDGVSAITYDSSTGVMTVTVSSWR